MIAVLAMLLVMFVLQLFTAFWWWIMAVPFIYGLTRSRSVWESAWKGMLSAGLLWLGMAVYHFFTGSDVIAARVAGMMSIHSPALLLFVTSLVAAIAAGAAGSSGRWVRGVFQNI